MKRNVVIILLLNIFLISSCVTHQPKTDIVTDSKFVEYSVKTWKSIDITCDVIFNISGDLYKQNKINEQQKQKLIDIGNTLKTSLNIVKAGIESYMWAEQVNLPLNNSKDKLVNDLVIVVKSFYILKEQFSEIYKAATGQTIKIPDIFLFDTITNALMRG